MTTSRALALLVAAPLAGCSPLSHQVERELVRELPIGQKLKLFDAENEVNIALEEREELVRTIRDLKLRVDETEARIDDAESDADRARDKKDSRGAELAGMAAAVFDLKLDYLERELVQARIRLALQDELILVARAKHELAKAKLTKELNLPGAATLDLEDFEEQVNDRVAEVHETQQEVEEKEQRTAAAQRAWLAARDELKRASGGGLGSAWLEDTSEWGEW